MFSRLLTALLCVALAVAVLATQAEAKRPPSARTAGGSEVVHESVSAQLTGNRGATQLTERGSAHGTFSCSASVYITLSYTKAHITFDCGGLAGSGTTSYYVSGETGYFNGTLTLTRGSGRYAHSAGSRLTIKGTLHRGTYTLSCQVTGTVSV
jgi:hypothetical protein